MVFVFLPFTSNRNSLRFQIFELWTDQTASAHLCLQPLGFKTYVASWQNPFVSTRGKSAISSLPPTPKLLHLVEFIETIISRNGASAAGALLERLLPRRVILGEARPYFATTVLLLVI